MKIKKLMIGGALLTTTAMAAEKPNILFIHIDDMDFNEIGAYEGTGQCWTPNMDALIHGGMKFNRAYVTSPVCVPSRFATVTGRYASRNAYHAEHTAYSETLNIENTSPLSNPKQPPFIEGNEYTFAKLMKQSGYTTGLFGKWHNDRVQLERPIPNMITGDPKDPEVAKQIKAQYDEIVARVKKDSGFDVVGRLYYDNKEQFACPKELHTLNSPWITEGAIEFLEANKDRPFVLYYSNPIPHGQMVGPLRNKNNAGKKVIGRHIEHNAIGDRLLATPAGFLDKAPQVQPSTEDMLERFWVNAPEANPDAALLTWLDDSVGALIGKLCELGLEDNTMIFFLSDHQSVDKFTPFECGAHVPMAVSWKGHIPAGTVSDSLVCSLDITATMVDLAGIQVPADCVLDGFSMKPLFADLTSVIRDSVMIEFGLARGLVTKDWEYVAVRFPEGMETPTVEKPQLHTGGNRRDRAERMVEQHPGALDSDQLYRLDKDPTQSNNLWNNPEYQPVGQQLKKQLFEKLSEFPHRFGEAGR